MARIFSSGFELNSVDNGVEFDSQTGAVEIVTDVVRTGDYAGHSVGGTGNRFEAKFASSELDGPFWFRCYVRLGEESSAQGALIQVVNNSGTNKVSIELDGNVLRLFRAGATQVGSDSPALSLNTWYRIELYYKNVAGNASEMEARIDGVAFASTTSGNTDGAVANCRFGNENGIATYDVYFDDIAINDGNGSFENSWPGEGNIVHLKPSAAGDNSAWTNDYQNVDEVTPDDATSLVSSNSNNATDDHEVEAMGSYMGSAVVHVGVRFRGAGASNNARFVPRIKASSGGTVEEGTTIIPGNTTWRTNTPSGFRLYPLTLYNLPGASTDRWSQNRLNSTQIGYRITATSTNAANISTIWLLVDYKSPPRRQFVLDGSRLG